MLLLLLQDDRYGNYRASVAPERSSSSSLVAHHLSLHSCSPRPLNRRLEFWHPRYLCRTASARVFVCQKVCHEPVCEGAAKTHAIGVQLAAYSFPVASKTPSSALNTSLASSFASHLSFRSSRTDLHNSHENLQQHAPPAFLDMHVFTKHGASLKECSCWLTQMWAGLTRPHHPEGNELVLSQLHYRLSKNKSV